MALTPIAMSDELIFESQGSTQIKTVRFRYTWTISNFSFYCNAMNSKIVSPTFSNQLNSSHVKWYLEINPNGWHQADKPPVSCMSLYLHFESCNTVSDFETNFKLSIVNTKSEEVYKFEDNQQFGQGKFHGINSFIEKAKLLNEKATLYPDDKLTILCDITASAESLNIWEKFKPSVIENTILTDLELLLQNPSFSDVTLVSGEKEFQAHKAILAARSSVFKDMFDADTEERQQNRFELNDINHEVLNKMVQYIYTDKASDLDKFGPDLLNAAEKYGLKGLTARCVNAMCTNLSVENASEFLILGDLYHQVELKEQAKYYICTRALEIIKTVGWKLMGEKHPHLVTELFCVMAASQFTSAKPTFTFGTITQNVQDATCAKPILPTFKPRSQLSSSRKCIKVSKLSEKHSSSWPPLENTRNTTLQENTMVFEPVAGNSVSGMFSFLQNN